MMSQCLAGFSFKTMHTLAKWAARVGTEWLLRYSVGQAALLGLAA
jgi:hypothetical protein